MPAYTHPVRVAFVDTDASGRIHFTAMLRYFESAEQEFMRSLGFNYHDAPMDIGFPRVKVECEYRSAITFDDLLDIEVSVKRIGTASYTLDFIARKSGAVAANGSLTIVCIDRRAGKARDIPPELRQALSGSAS